MIEVIQIEIMDNGYFVAWQNTNFVFHKMEDLVEHLMTIEEKVRDKNYSPPEIEESKWF